MKNIRFFALIFVLFLASFPFLVFADGYGPHGDEGMLSAGDQRKLANSGASFMSQSNVANGGTQIRYGTDMSPIMPTVSSAGGVVSMGGGSINAVNDALSKVGYYTMSSGTQIFSAQTVSNVIRFSGVDQVGQNMKVLGNPVARDFNSNAMNAIAGLRADPIGVANHAQMLANFADDPSNIGKSVTNGNLMTAGYKIQQYIQSSEQPVVPVVSAGVIPAVTKGVIYDGTGIGGSSISTRGRVLPVSNLSNNQSNNRSNGNFISQTDSMYGTPQ